jgi:ubiquinone/menaquinone biosynthesis C-methylase UbiE
MMSERQSSNWNTFARVNASQRWRKPSAAMGRAMTEAIVREAQVAPNMRVLDVACGTGEPAISIATELDGTGEVIATDISPEPLKIGEARARERGLNNIRFQQADVHQLPFADGSFDRVTSRLGAMFFADLPKALREVCRVLKPGGRAVLLAWGAMEQPYFDTTIGAILRTLPELQLPASGANMFKFGAPGVLPAAMRAAGFAAVEESFMQVPWNWPGTPEELWEYFREVTIPFKPLFETIPPGRREEVDAAVLHALHERFRDSQVEFEAEIVIVSAGAN